MTVRPDPRPPPPDGVGLATDWRDWLPAPGSASAGAPDRESGGLPSGALAVLLTWDGSGQCRDARLDGAAGEMVADPALLGDGWLELLHPDDRSTAADAVCAALAGEAGGGTREEPLRLQTGERWAVLRVRAAGGAEATAGASGVLVDATRSIGRAGRTGRLVEGFNRLRHPDEIVRAMLDEGVPLVGASTGVLYVLSDDDELVAAGASGVPEDVLDGRFARIARGSPLPAAEVMRTGRPVTIATPVERRRRYPQLDAPETSDAFTVVPLNDAAGRPFGALGLGFEDERRLRSSDPQLLQDVAAQCALALDRARLAVAAERDQERLRFLDRLSGALSSTLKLDATLTELAGMAVPRIADWCVVRLVESTTDPRPVVGAAHVDPARVAALRRLAERIPRDLEQVGQVGEALRAGRPVIRGSQAGPVLRSLFADDDGHRALDDVGVDGLAIFPLRARGRLLGAIGFGNRAGRVFAVDELELAESVAARAAVIVDNARLFEEQSVVARALQDSLLPGSLPEIPGVQLGARYRAAGRGLDVGGDFYDAFQADANWWIFAVGDVCGHGVEAAATTGLVRHTIRSSAMAGVMPSAILARLNQMLLRHSAEWADTAGDHVPISPRFCTVLVGAAQPTPRGVDLILCSGGHPLPLVGRAVGRVEPVGVPGTLLGVTDDVSLRDTVVHLDPGEALVCYTDGLIDRRRGRSRAFGEEGVVKALYQG
ncbi:MAG TPA: SpoIIE family protein phosphatase, partial [Acidimicrobiales bacterium]|nr:SpoIIE family protein phosphatase [Acidimicrobiales bacterium]